MTPLYIVGTIDRMDRCDIFTEPSWYSRECNYYQTLTTDIND